MSEPEEVLADGALYATRLVRDLWSRRSAALEDQAPRLSDLRHRLELFVAAVFPHAPDFGVAAPPAPPTLLDRIARHRTSHLHPEVAISCADHHRIRLPATLAGVSPAAVPGRYRLLALEQAARVDRGTMAALPYGDLLLRDLYLLAEAAAVDAVIAGIFPRLASDIEEARREDAAQRPRMRRPSARELEVERLLLLLLAARAGTPAAPFVAAASPAASLGWARGQRSAIGGLAGPYRGLAPVSLWGVPSERSEVRYAATVAEGDEATPSGTRVRQLPRRPRPRGAADEEDEAESGMWIVRADDPQEKAEDPAGLQRPADRDASADPGELADALSELPEARLVRRPGRVAEVLTDGEPILRVPGVSAAPPPGALAYPEWDWRAGAYRTGGAIVRERPASEGAGAWVEAALRRHAPLIATVRRDFERLRPRRVALRRQRDGAELDVDAMVAAWADRRAGGVAPDRYYVDRRPGRRDAAITLLVDVSASTDSWVQGDRRIIDAEKETVLVASESLAALGDRHAVLAFASAGPACVTLSVLKRFEEVNGNGAIGRRIAGLEPGGYTRTGAAIRHATAGLARQPARHRLLLLLSDGRPNDIDEYEGRYGIEDTRAAVGEARLQGVHVHCLTIDREAPRYANRIFGRDFSVLTRAERLPGVLTALLRDLVRG